VSKARVIPGENGNPPTVVFYCVGCGQNHAVPFDRRKPPAFDLWFFDGNLENPTIEPSVLVIGGGGYKIIVCHVVVTAGLLHYQGDDLHLPNQVSAMRDCELITD
jgi:hypothetical protein